MRLAYATFYDASSTLTGFSRINSVGYYIARALSRAGHELEHLGPIHTRLDLPFRLTQSIYEKALHKSYNYHRTGSVCRRISVHMDRKLADSSASLVICPINPGSPPIAYSKSNKPIVLWWDSTLKTASRSYHDFSVSRMSQRNLRDGLRNEAAAMERCDMIAFASQWACDNAIADYNLNPAKVRCVPFGANIDNPLSAGEVESAIAHRAGKPWHLLFIGLDWRRKDGDTVLETARLLKDRGVDVKVTLIGGQPDYDLPDYVQSLGILDRANPQNLVRLKSLLAESHLLFVPSRNEAFGHVFCEAAAHGLPSLSRDVDGIASALPEGVTGHRLPADADATAFANRIQGLLSDRAGYAALCRRAHAEYLRRLNWDACVGELLNQAQTLLPKSPASPMNIDLGISPSNTLSARQYAAPRHAVGTFRIL